MELHDRSTRRWKFWYALRSLLHRLGRIFAYLAMYNHTEGRLAGCTLMIDWRDGRRGGRLW